MLNTKNMSAGSGKPKPVIGVGNQVIKINSISLDVTPYDKDAYNVTLHVESKPIDGEFEGFLKDPNKTNGPRYAGQVGKVRYSPYAFKDTVLPNSGKQIYRDSEILKSMIFVSEVLGKRTELDAIEASTIEDFITSCNKLFSNSKYINACIGGREWENKEGYINYDLFLPRMSKDGVPLEAMDVENSRLLTFSKADHIKTLAKKEGVAVGAFEPSANKGDDFDL